MVDVAQVQSALGAPVPGVSEKDYAALFHALVDAGYESSNGDLVVAVDGATLTMPAPSDMSASVGGGFGRWGRPYISFNRTEQGVLLTVGGVGLTAAICAVPAVGQSACGVAQAIVAGATYYLIEKGRCPASRPYLRYYFLVPARAECVK